MKINYLKVIKSYLFMLPLYLVYASPLFIIWGVDYLARIDGSSIVVCGLIIILLFVLYKHRYFKSIELFYVKFSSLFFNNLYNITLNDLNEELNKMSENDLKKLMQDNYCILPSNYDMINIVFSGHNLGHIEFNYLRESGTDFFNNHYPTEKFILRRALSDAENILMDKIKILKKST